MSENTCNSLNREIILSHNDLFDALRGYIETGPDGSVYYYNSDGRYHRTGGPAVVRADGFSAWFLNDKVVTEEEFNACIKSGNYDEPGSPD